MGQFLVVTVMRLDYGTHTNCALSDYAEPEC